MSLHDPKLILQQMREYALVAWYYQRLSKKLRHAGRGPQPDNFPYTSAIQP